ncbi:hypothetical protein M427DRAFT_59226 [Gonapodya prolifera JEL478]|uniref:Uncharacterized protein n=1 Tax=Gonapodya prolifera (strain JEL478) TaxID=1344416 RepID=A0A139A7C1_GONPJ|nr:hypothetical protein M427DRAFT_59226 [Gonapodya prolifera JEL478]|eukprot:KXS12697.1 hypothetical protein M427DRAFT_59226 [Gonapodya prolifera JEL478]
MLMAAITSTTASPGSDFAATTQCTIQSTAIGPSLHWAGMAAPLPTKGTISLPSPCVTCLQCSIASHGAV